MIIMYNIMNNLLIVTLLADQTDTAAKRTLFNIATNYYGINVDDKK